MTNLFLKISLSIYHSGHTLIMYKLVIFLITVILALFEVIAYLFFDKLLNSNILILVLIGILPYAFDMFREDVITLHEMRKGRPSKKILLRKSGLFILERLSFYFIALSAILLIYSGLFILIDNKDILQMTV